MGEVDRGRSSATDGAQDGGAAPDPDALVPAAVELARELAARAAALPAGRRELRREARLAALVGDEAAKRFTFLLTDRVARPDDHGVAARQLHDLVADHGVPTAFPALDRIALAAAARLGPRLPGLVMPLVTSRLRRESQGVIVDGAAGPLARHLERRRHQGFRSNLNLLGEAVLGEEEAERRALAVAAHLASPAVTHASVKLSSITANLSVAAFEATVERVRDRLRMLYRGGRVLTLDMEEYRDLHLTLEAFRRTLDEPDLAHIEGGIVLQAYLPDAFEALVGLTHWATERRARGGAAIKVRLVKGANLAMERVEAEVHGWPLATYGSKAEVDANYKRLLEWALRPEHAAVVRVGVGSHNLFDLAWALLLAESRGVAERVDVEMLEGMANRQAQVVAERARTGGARDVVLYTPVAQRHDFRSAVAYLARRLDENTAPQNFLAHLHRLARDPGAFEEERRRFEAAVAARDEPTAVPHRGRRAPAATASGPAATGAASPAEAVAAPPTDDAFANEPDTDLAVAAERGALVEAVRAWRPPPPLPEAGSLAEVDEVVATARRGAKRWAASTLAERRLLLHAVADELGRSRAGAVATMAHDAAKVLVEGDPEVSEAVDFARYYAQTTRLFEEVTDATFEPYGVVVVAAPWNFPLAIPAGGALAALAAGNAVILKPAPEAEGTAAFLAGVLRRAGVPEDLVQVVRVPEDERGRRLVTHPEVGAVVLTGSWETAARFADWRPGLALHAETSGKNALVVTASADVDLAVRDVVRSAFSHAGQKCSAASLAIVDARLLGSGSFLRQLADAVRSLPTGPATDPASVVGPLVGPPRGPLDRALHHLGPGESWLVEPRPLDEEGLLWAPGVRLGVLAGSWFHRTECFGPVLGVMAADSLEQATRWQNEVAYGLTGGLHSLAEHDVAWWLEHVEVGNAYVNKAMTGAVVARQPFGGWKRSVVGPGAKAGGPNYVASLGTWRDVPGAAPSYERWWRGHVALEHDPAGLRSERNVFRYRRLPRGALVRWDGVAPEGQLRRALDAARVTGTEVELSAPHQPASLRRTVTVEDDAAFLERVASGHARPDRLRLLGTAGDDLRRACVAQGVALFDQPVLASGRIELLRWVREQAVSETRHRYGNLL
ncbi:MAG: aldehyde dehydrogenase family protein [Acidimicrobiia bacterium]|nr:aldehyde dehydrogenase family protein [Acidimicrobiia bacterium]